MTQRLVSYLRGLLANRDIRASMDSEAVDGHSKADVFIQTGLTPEEYVLSLLHENNGRLTQQSICDLTGWSAGAVSRLLSDMETEGEICRIRIGHGKIVFLPGAKPERFAPPDLNNSTSLEVVRRRR